MRHRVEEPSDSQVVPYLYDNGSTLAGVGTNTAFGVGTLTLVTTATAINGDLYDPLIAKIRNSRPILGEVERAVIRETVHRLPDALHELWTWLQGLEFTGIHDWFVTLWVGFMAAVMGIASWFWDLFHRD